VNERRGARPLSTIQNHQVLTNGASSVEAAPSPAPLPRWQVTPELDVYENESGYLIQLNVPGASAESVNVQVLGAELHVRAEQAAVAGMKDVALAAFERHIALPSELDASTATAELREGVLQIRIQKSAAARRVRIPVNAN
jgi:HSP20 family protein